MLETDLYEPVKNLFQNMGYEVKAEVLDVDVLAVNDVESVAIELKLHLNLEVITQAVLRQRIADKVFIAVPSPKRADLRRWQNISLILRRLEIGLITVKADSAKITFPAKAYDRKAAFNRAKSQREALMEEFAKRHGDLNVGGVNGKTMTLYRERAILVAALSEKYGKIKISDLPSLSGNPKAKSIVENNYYDWFKKTGDTYSVTKKGKEETKEYGELKEILLSEVEGKIKKVIKNG